MSIPVPLLTAADREALRVGRRILEELAHFVTHDETRGNHVTIRFTPDDQQHAQRACGVLTQLLDPPSAEPSARPNDHTPTLSATHGDEITVLTRTADRVEEEEITDDELPMRPVLKVRVRYRRGNRKRPIQLRCATDHAQLLYEALTVLLTARPSSEYTKGCARQVLSDLRDAVTAKLPPGYPKQVGDRLPA